MVNLQRKKYRNFEYIYYKPENVNENEKLPVILFLHGAGTRNTNLDTLAGSNLFNEKVSVYIDPAHPCIIYAPLLMSNTWFDKFEQLQDFVKFMLTDEQADPKRLYFIGNSMGGYATWQLGMTMRDYVAAIVPICGGGMAWNYQALLNVPVWAVHGEKDGTVPCEESKKMVDRILKHNGNARFTLLEGVGHNSWNYTFGSTEIRDWLFDQCKQGEIPVIVDEFNSSSKIYG